MNKIKLCRRGCCPTIEKAIDNKKNYIIRDDFDGEVVLSKENIKHMYDVVFGDK